MCLWLSLELGGMELNLNENITLENCSKVFKEHKQRMIKTNSKSTVVKEAAKFVQVNFFRISSKSSFIEIHLVLCYYQFSRLLLYCCRKLRNNFSQSLATTGTAAWHVCATTVGTTLWRSRCSMAARLRWRRIPHQHWRMWSRMPYTRATPPTPSSIPRWRWKQKILLKRSKSIMESTSTMVEKAALTL